MLAGSVPPLHVVIDPTTNHSGGEDANGNVGAVGGSYPAYVYDAENRMTGSITSAALYGNYYNNYAYDAQNKRVWKNLPIYNQSWQSLQDVETYYFYGTDGKLMAQFTPNYSPRQVGLAASFGLISGTTRTYFGSRLLGNEDRLGSRGKYYPYGEDGVHRIRRTIM